MKKKLNKKFLSAVAVLALSGTLATGAVVLSACGGNKGEDKSTGKVYYVSADGVRSNAGTLESPKDPGFINDRLEIEAGDTIYLIPGTYKWDASWGENHAYNNKAIAITNSGAPGKNISFINAALDPKSGYTGTETKVTLDFSDMEFLNNNRGVLIYGNYIYWYGIDICGAGDNGMYIGGSYNTVEYCEFYNNRDTGLQLGRELSAQTSINQWPSYNLIKNCTSHNNYDDETYGENADGFAAKLTIGYGNVFDGCIAYRNSDDGWDLYAKSDSGNIGCVIIYNCVAFENGYLEYTQADMHQKLNYNHMFDEPDTNSFKTRDGDGNGFKLGGSVMEGDVKMYNCLSFQNRMHGVTDNSNPGYIKVEGVTSYDNSAAIDDDPSSATFGKVVSISNHDTHGNIDVARQSYSYNTVKNVLSVKSPMAKSLDSDAYRGSVMNSLLYAGSNTNVVKGSVDANTKVKTATQYTSQVAALSATDVFKQVPVVKDGDSYTYNVDALHDLERTAENRVHNKYRNADHSINMGDILAIKEDFDFSKYFGAGVSAGSYLNMTKWEDYAHFTSDTLFEGITSKSYATLLKAKETLTINSDEEQVYQDFEVPSMLNDVTIDWSSDSELLKIGKIEEISKSQSRYITVGVTRPADKDTAATLNATISYKNLSVTKQFELVIKKDNPSIGELSVRVTETDTKYISGGKIIMDARKQYTEPVLQVENGAYYNGTMLNASQYTVNSKYEFATSTKDNYEEVKGFSVNRPGVYKITHTVTLVGSNDSASMTYQIFVASTTADVDFDNGGNVSVYKDGYIIAGELTNVTGTLYTVASKDPIAASELEGNKIKEYEGVQHNDFRDTAISFSYSNDNNGAYYIYYALANASGNVTSNIYTAQIKTLDINTEEDFNKVAIGGKIGDEETSQTIYMLTRNLDFTGKKWTAGTGKFTGVLNGQGHTVANIVRNDPKIDAEKGTVSYSDDIGLFYDVVGGTIMNIKFDNIQLTGKQRTAIASSVHGGYFYNIAITNLYVYGNDQRTGGLIAHVYEGATPTEVSQVSIINPIPVLTASGEIDTQAAENNKQLYYIYGSGNRAAGIIGFIQTKNPMTDNCVVYVKDCYVESYIKSTGYSVSSIVGEYNENGQMALATLNGYEFNLEITNCVSAGVLNSTGTGRIGGMLGYHNGASRLRILRCVSIQTIYYKGALLETAQKNQSGTIGNFSTSADVRIAQCIALMEEYNTDYDVIAYTANDLKRTSSFTNANVTFDWAGEGAKWSFVYEDETTQTLKRPYLMLNFLGNWDTDAAEQG